VELNRLISLLEQALGRKAAITRLPPQPGDVPLTCADVTKAREQLGYHPQVKIEQGIPLFATWFKQHALFGHGTKA
jgi:UDP-glucuronate 4-epimerase